MKTEVLSLETLHDSQLLNETQAAQLLCIAPGTLAVWRCTGRYELRYIKAGRLIRYQASDLREFIAKRSRIHTGEV
jgi:hypothetical protein